MILYAGGAELIDSARDVYIEILHLINMPTLPRHKNRMHLGTSELAAGSMGHG